MRHNDFICVYRTVLKIIFVQFFANLIKIFVFIYCLRCKMAGISHTTVNGSRWIAKIMTTDIEATATDKAMLLSNCGGLHFTINDESVHILWIFDCELPSTHLNGFEPSQYNVDVNIFFFSLQKSLSHTHFLPTKKTLNFRRSVQIKLTLLESEDWNLPTD